VPHTLTVHSSHSGHLRGARSRRGQRWVVAPAAAVAHNCVEALTCTPIASLLCHSDRDCCCIDLGTVCIATGRVTATHTEMPGPESAVGSRCSSAHHTGDFCKRIIAKMSPVTTAGSGWSAAPAGGGCHRCGRPCFIGRRATEAGVSGSSGLPTNRQGTCHLKICPKVRLRRCLPTSPLARLPAL